MSALYTLPSHGAYGGGCSGAANEAVWGFRDKVLEPVRAEMRTIQHALDREPALQEARRTWGVCMTGAGISVRSRAELDALIRTEIVEPLRLIRDSGELEELASRERQLAISVLRCDEGLLAAQQAASAECESRYIRAHRTELDEILRLAYSPGS